MERLAKFMAESIKPLPWEIWHAKFNFKRSGYKFRPVIVVSVADDMLAIMITSKTNKLTLENDYSIRDWKEAGLIKPSIARIDRTLALPFNYIGTSGFIGKLTAYDKENIIHIINNLF